MQTSNKQNIVDSILSGLDYSPYKSSAPLGGGISLTKAPSNTSSVQSSPQNLWNTPEFAHTSGLMSPRQMSAVLGAGQMGQPWGQPLTQPLSAVQSQSPAAPAVAQEPSLWEKTKKFAGSPLGRSLIATGLTGGLTAAFGGSPLEAVSYGAQSGGTAAEVYERNRKTWDKLDQDALELKQKAFDNEQNRYVKMDQLQTNAELRKSLADIAYERALGLGEQKNDYLMNTDERRQGYKQQNAAVQNQYALGKLAQDYDYRNDILDRRFEQEENMAALRRDYETQNNLQKRDWQVEDRDVNRLYDIEDREVNRDYQQADNALAYARKNDFNDKEFDQRKQMAAIEHDYETQITAQKLQDQMQMAVMEGDMEKARLLYKMQLQYEKDAKLAELKGDIAAAHPTRRIKNYEYFHMNNPYSDVD